MPSKLDDARARTIRERYATEHHLTQRDLAKEYNVSQTTIMKILRGVYYPDSGGPITYNFKKNLRGLRHHMSGVFVIDAKAARAVGAKRLGTCPDICSPFHDRSPIAYGWTTSKMAKHQVCQICGISLRLVSFRTWNERVLMIDSFL
tara:strand:+ start:152 stop:592 length:441 start_codon:yes stop_codon:yes gene_type:complete